MRRKAVRHGHDASVRCLAISPDASYLVSGDMRGYLVVWGTTHGNWIQKSRVHAGPILAACYLGADKFVTAGADGDVKLWRSHVGSEVHQVPSSAPVLLALAAPHSSLLTVTSAGEVALQPITPGPAGDASAPSSRRGPPRWTRRQENITRAACDDHRVYLAVGRAVHVLKMSDGRPERQLAAGAPVTSLACLPPEASDSVMGVVLLGLEDGRVGVALADRGELVTTVAHAGEVTDIAVNAHDPERPRMATGGRDGVTGFGFAGHADRLVYNLLGCTAGGQVLFWGSRMEAVTEQRCRPGSRPDLISLPDGRLAALLPRDDDTNVVDLNKMSCIASFGDHTADVSGVSTTKRSLVSASLDGSVKLWQPEQTGLASTDAALLALEVLHTTPDRVTCYLATVSRRGHVTVWHLNWTDQKMPKAIYTANVFEKEKDADSQSVLLATIGSISAADPTATDSGPGSFRFIAGCLTGKSLFRVEVTVPLEGAEPAAGCHTIQQLSQPTEAPVLCLTAGRQRSLMLGDTTGRVTVIDGEMKKHAQYRCGAGSDPSITHITYLGGGSVITCDRNGMLCTLQQTDKLNILRASWQPALMASADIAPPPASGVQLDKATGRAAAPPPPGPSSVPPAYRDLALGTPTALLTSDTEPTVVGDSTGQLCWAGPDSTYQSIKAHSSAVTWLGRDQSRPDIRYSCGGDRRLVVWQLGPTSDTPVSHQVGEFEFASSVRVCAALPAQGIGSASRLICGDDRGRLHCLLVDLRRVPNAPPPVPSSSGDENGEMMMM